MTRAGTFPALCLNRKAAFRVLVFRGTTVRTRHFRLYKHYAHEGGISSPFIACWPAVIKPTANPVNMVGHETDVMPTFRTGLRYLSKDGGSRPIPSLVGESLVPVVQRKSRSRGLFIGSMKAIRLFVTGNGSSYQNSRISRNSSIWKPNGRSCTIFHRLNRTARRRWPQCGITGQRASASSHGLCPGRLQGSG
jgi:hypothetical protein